MSEAFGYLEKGSLVREVGWSAGEYIGMREGCVIDENGVGFVMDSVDLLKEWELYVEKPVRYFTFQEMIRQLCCGRAFRRWGCTDDLSIRLIYGFVRLRDGSVPSFRTADILATDWVEVK